MPAPVGVRLRIPALDIDRSIVEVPLTYDSSSDTWVRDLEQLFPEGRQDLVGHYVGSATPGQPGNMILVGHNYGHRTKGVFVRLEQIDVGQQVEVVNALGQTFIYRVRQVMRVPWSEQSQQELLEHQAYLSVDGPERLTLVTCGGSVWKPFPLRVYVVADPAY
jgi:LPXTG-site transpeptidase (sortase) family protein